MTTVYVLIDDIEGRTFAEVSGDGSTAVTLAFVDRKAAHDYRNRHGLPQHLQPVAFAPARLDEASRRSTEEVGEPATWRLVTDRSAPPVILADRIDPFTGEIVERCLWGEYFNFDWIWQAVTEELYA